MLIHVTVDETVVMEEIVPPWIVFGRNISSKPSQSFFLTDVGCELSMAAIDGGEVMRVRAEGVSPGGLPCFPSLIGKWWRRRCRVS